MSLSRITATSIQNGTVVAAEIADNAIIEAKVQDSAITEAKVQDSAITNAKVAPLNISENKISSASITETKLANEAVTEIKLANSSVTALKIADSSVTSGKLNVDGDINFNGANIDRSGLGTENVSSASNVLKLDYANATYFISQFFENTTLTPNNVPVGGCVMVLKAGNAGAYTVSYAGNPRFAGNTAPILTSGGTDYLFFICESDTNYLVTSQINAPAYQ